MEPSCSAVYKANPVYTGAHPVLAGPGTRVRDQPVASLGPELLNLYLRLRSSRAEGILQALGPRMAMMSQDRVQNGIRPGRIATLLP